MSSSLSSPSSRPNTHSVALVWRVSREGGHARIALEDSSKLVIPDKGWQENPTSNISNNISNNNSNRDNDNNNSASIPDSVLQWERQLRKAQHAKKAGIQLDPSDLHVVYVDESIVVVNKPSGVLTVPGINSHSSILDLVYDKYGKAKDEMEMPPLISPANMIVHRLDMDTSGIVVFSRNEHATRRLHQIFRDRNHAEVSKEYQALVMGHLPSQIQSGTIDLPLQRDHAHPPFMRVATPESEAAASEALKDLHQHGWKKLVRKAPKPSWTYFDVLERGFHKTTHLPFTRLRLVPTTGRTHQLRVHCAALGYPIVGDPPYSLNGEASPHGGLDQVASYYYYCDDNEGKSSSSPSSSSSIDAAPVVEPLPRCPMALQNSWTVQYVPNEKPMCLHASMLSLLHPVTNERMTFRVEPPF